MSMPHYPSPSPSLSPADALTPQPADASAALALKTTLVLIVGAGPTGLTAALELSRLGVPVRLIDKLAAPSTTSRALAVQARTLELMQQRGLSDAMLAAGTRAHAASLYGRGKQLGKVELSRIPGRHNYVLLLSQAHTERLLTDQLLQQGVAVERSVELISCAPLPESNTNAPVNALLRHADGRLEELDAACVISAEGAHSSIRHALGLEFEGKSLKPTYVLGDVHLEGAVPDDELSIFIADHGFLAVFPLGPGHFRLIAIDPEQTADEQGSVPTLEQLQQLYDANATIPARLHDLVWSSYFHINSRMLKTLRQGRFFFGGDSAHIHSPAGGQGMNTGIQDMIDLCWKLALVLQGEATPDLLDTYQQDRLPVIRRIVSRTETATDMLNSHSAVAHKLVTYIAPLFLSSDLIQDLATQLISELNFNYRDGALSETHGKGGTLHGGDRVPDLDVIALDDSNSNGESLQSNLFALLDPSRFTLLIAQGAASADLPDDWQMQLQPWRHLISVRTIAPWLTAEQLDRGFAELFGEQRLLLVRPDSYLCLTADVRQWPLLIEWLQNWLPR